MDHRDAVDMLHEVPLATSGPQSWADLGCGTGTFTRALAELLPRESIIHALDRDAGALLHVPERFEGTHIVKHIGDFVNDTIPATDLDGILLANALHFVRDQSGFIRKAADHLKPSGIFLFVEYDTDTPNPWVPHPLSFDTLSELLQSTGLASVTHLAERPSVLGRALIYSAYAQRK